MKKSVVVVLVFLCIFSILFAGCTSSASNDNTGTQITPTSPQPEFNNGDVIGKDVSSTFAVAVVNFDSSRDSYTIEDATKNADGSWQVSTSPSQRDMSQSIIEKLYSKKVGTISGLSHTSQNTVASSSQTTVSNIVSESTTSVPQSSSSSGVQIRITYSGAWSGSYGDAGATQSIDGTGSKVIILTNPSYNLVSCAFQKKDGSQDEMKVEILKDGTVLNTRSTTAAYGVVAVAAMLNGGSTSSTNSGSSKTVLIKVYYEGQWSGAYGEAGAMQSVDGAGSQTYTLTNPNYIVSSTFQKKDNSASELRVEISEDGNVLKSGSTTAAYGVVLVSATV
jgi:hypothetical protein